MKKTKKIIFVLTIFFFFLTTTNYACAEDINWTKITNPIYEMFMGNETQGLTGILGDENLMGMFILFFFLIMTIIFGLGTIIGTVVLIPSLFAVFQYLPPLRIIVAIILGLIFGMGLHKLFRR